MSDDTSYPAGQGGRLQLSIDEPVSHGMYSNFQVVGSNETEFVLDFAYLAPGQNKGKVRARVILSPKHAKALAGILARRVQDFESRYGTIPPPASVAGPPKGGLVN